jgi:hypothetical protein
MKDSKVALLVRIPASLKEKLAEIAKREHRSLNQQIEFFLDCCIHTDGEQKENVLKEKKKRTTEN